MNRHVPIADDPRSRQQHAHSAVDFLKVWQEVQEVVSIGQILIEQSFNAACREVLLEIGLSFKQPLPEL